MKKIYYYGVGSLHNDESSVDGGKHIRLPLVESLKKNGFDISWLGFETTGSVKNHYLDLIGLEAHDYNHDVRSLVDNVSSRFMNDEKTSITDDTKNYIKNNPGILLVELRPKLDKPGYNFMNEYNVQMEYVYEFLNNNYPVFIWDQDGWCDMLPDDIKDDVVLLKPYTEMLDTSFPKQEEFLFGWFKPSFDDRLEKLALNKKFDVGYCGNVYGRRDDFYEYFAKFADSDRAVCIQGNWLRKKYADRDFSLDNFPHFMFFGRTPHWSTLPTIAMSKSVFHFSNPHQQNVGMPTARVFEALMGKATLFCSSKIKNIDRFVPDELIVDTGDELFEKWNEIEYNDAWNEYRQMFVNKLGVYEHTYDYRAQQLIKYINKYYGG
jgi:hypothetical protein